jgi:hypothetical protein
MRFLCWLITKKNSQLPGNIVLRQLGVRRWLTFIVFAWGLVQFGMTFVRSWGWMIICRILMGIFEVCSQLLFCNSGIDIVFCSGLVLSRIALYHVNLVCGIVMLNSQYSLIFCRRYKRHEVQKRYASRGRGISIRLIAFFSLAAFFLLSVTTGGLSPILAWAFSLLNGKANLAGWRWIFVSALSSVVYFFHHASFSSSSKG